MITFLKFSYVFMPCYKYKNYNQYHYKFIKQIVMIETILNSSPALKSYLSNSVKLAKLRRFASNSHLTKQITFSFAYTSHSIEPLIQPYSYMRKDIFQKHHNVKNNNPWEGWFTAEGSRNFFQGELSNIHKKQLRRVNIPTFKTGQNNSNITANNSNQQSSAQLNNKVQTSTGKIEISAIGLGTYKGSLDQSDDLIMFNSIIDTLKHGVNVIDTCNNFRGGRSEKIIGQTLNYLLKRQTSEFPSLTRNQLFISSKIGYVRQQLPSSIPSSSVINSHCVHPLYLEKSLNNSLQNMNLKTLDVCYLNNFSQCQLQALGLQEFEKQLCKAFEFLQKARNDRKIINYGIASWEGFRVEPKNKNHLNLDRIKELAQKVGGHSHGFKFIQVPINIMMPQAFAEKNQKLGSLLDTAEELEINVVSCSPILNGSLINIPLPADKLRCKNNGAKHLQFIRSIPTDALVCTLIGQKRHRHVKKNLQVMFTPKLSEQEWIDLIVPQKMTQQKAYVAKDEQ